MTSRGYPIQFIEQPPTLVDVTREVLEGLTKTPKQLPAKLFYDRRGSELFEAITRRPEYYLTTAELSIVRTAGDELKTLLDPSTAIIELGSGSGAKTRHLLQLLPRARAYVAIDISQEALRAALVDLSHEFPRLRMVGVAADYLQPIPGLDTVGDGPKLLVFFGSTLGNFEPEEAGRFLRRWAQAVGSRDRLLIGIDLQKDPERLYAAYNDAAGVTAAFNRNILRRVNREGEADFNENAFAHRALYNAGAGRIEMYLVSQERQRVTVAGQSFDFAEGEVLLTEWSYKYTVEGFWELARGAGWDPIRAWTDADDLFSLHYLAPSFAKP